MVAWGCQILMCQWKLVKGYEEIAPHQRLRWGWPTRIDQHVIVHAPFGHSFILMAIERQCVLQVHHLLILLVCQASSYGGLSSPCFNQVLPDEMNSLGLLGHSGNTRLKGVLLSLIMSLNREIKHVKATLSPTSILLASATYNQYHNCF